MVDETKENVRGDNVAFENAEVKILDTEKVLDTDPELYKNRALDAIEKQYYLDAMAEAEKAIQYGNNWPRYQAVKARVLLATEKYDECITYLLKGSDLWKRKDDMLELSNEDKDFVRYAFSVCYRQLGYPPEKLPEIILTADGRGMCGSIQEAVDKYSDKKITLTGGVYTESILATNKNITIIGSYYQKPIINGSWKIINGSICMSNTILIDEENDRHPILEINGSGFELNDIIFKGNGKKTNENDEDQTGLLITKCKEGKRIYGLIFENLDAGMTIKDTSISVSNCKFSYSTVGLAVVSTKAIYTAKISNCNFEYNECGIISGYNGRVDVKSSKIYMCRFGAIASKHDENSIIQHNDNAGYMKISNGSEIIGSSQAAIAALHGGQVYIEDSIEKNNTNLFVSDGEGGCYRTNVDETGNNAFGSIGESVKSIFKSLFS